MCERVVREIVDRLLGTFRQLLQHIKLSAAYSELLLDRSARDAESLDNRANRVNYFDYLGSWRTIGAC